MMTWIITATIGLLALTGLASAIYVTYRILRIAEWGTACKAKLLCTAVFLSGREPSSVLRVDLAGFQFRIFRDRINRVSRSVDTTFLGLVKSRAIYRDGLGSTLPVSIPERELRSQEIEISSTVSPLPDEQWQHWTREEASAIGVNYQQVEKWLDNDIRLQHFHKDNRTRALVVIYDGKILCERYGPGFTEDTRLGGFSASKSMVNALVGVLVEEGRLSVDEPAPVPEWQRAGDPRSAITLDHLLRMCSGLEWSEVGAIHKDDVAPMEFGAADTAAYAANKPLEFEPGTRWKYSSGSTQIIMRIIRNTLDLPLPEYFAFPRKALFERIGMRSAILEPDASGTLAGCSHMYATGRDWARFGLLYACDGVWKGRRILPEGWVDYTKKPTPCSELGSYGAHFWTNGGNDSGRTLPKLPPDTFAAHGRFHQTVIVVPSRKVVVARLGHTTSIRWDLDGFTAAILKALP